jgi:prepilin-type N-terminal cleavage/methylation domain-containing protein
MNAARAKCQRRARGFTLVELMVSLVAGLVIGVAVMGLSRIATTTFHEETRASTTELALRVASERLRADLARAAYMSTVNIQNDPQVSKEKGQSQISFATTFPGIGKLAGIAYTRQGSASGAVGTLSNENGLAPDSILLGGNFTTADEYIVQSVVTGGACGGQVVTLSTDSAALLRHTLTAKGVAKSAAEVRQAMLDAFQPVTDTSNNGQFMARVVDDSGHTQFVALCAAKANVVSTPTGGVTPIVQVHLDPATPLLDAATTGGNGGTTGFGVGRMTINPVQLVRWSIRRVANARLDSGSTAENAAKFDLFRTWVDAKGNEVRGELIAEYAVDLSFGFTVSNGLTPPTLTSTDLGIAQPKADPLQIPVGGSGAPQDIRAIRFRLSLRTAMPDRTEPLAGPAAGYVYRYCITPGGCGSTRAYARVRTIVSDVSLTNQFR